MDFSSSSRSGEFPVTYVRHVKSEANREGNKSVHDLDPPLLDGIEDEESGFLGRKFCELVVLPYFTKRKVTHIAASPSKRVLSTLVASLSCPTLRSVKITIFPGLIEQTDWRSDLPSSFEEIKALLSHELARKGGDIEYKDLRIDFTLLLAPTDFKDTSAVYKRFAMAKSTEALLQIRQDNETAGKGDIQNRPWYRKRDLWDPESLHDRGQEVSTEMAIWMAKNVEVFPGPEFVIFGHGGFASFLTEEVGDIDTDARPPKLSGWMTGEIRKYYLPWRLVKNEMKGGLLREEEQSRRKRLHIGQNEPCPVYDKQGEREKAERQRLCVMDIARQNREHPEFGGFYRGGQR